MAFLGSVRLACKMETLRATYAMAKPMMELRAVTWVTFEAIEEQGVESHNP